MKILLPPSAGKSPGSIEGFNWDQLSYPQLNPIREEIGAALQQLALEPEALTVLNLGIKVADEVWECRHLWQLPVAPASEIYTGVLYQAAQLNDEEIKAKAERYVRIVSALWGLVSPQDMIMRYRLSMDTKLIAGKSVDKLWRKALTEILSEENLILDCCSGPYQKAWLPGKSTSWRERVLSVKVLKNGKVVSHWAKHYRGLLCSLLLQAPINLDDLSGVEELVACADEILHSRGLARVTQEDTNLVIDLL